MRYLKSKLYMKFYEGEGEGNPPPPPPPPPPTTFTQEQVNSFLAKEKKAWEAKAKASIDELNKLKSEAGQDKNRVAELEATIESIEKQYMSKEEITKRDLEKKAAEDKKKFDELVSTGQMWQNNFQSLLVENEIVKASVKHGAFSEQQMLTQLGGKAKVLPVLADGKPTGKYQVVVTINDKGKELELSADEAVKFMKDKPEEFGNLFKANVTGGVGGNNNGAMSAIDIKKAASDPETYRKNRERIKNG